MIKFDEFMVMEYDSPGKYDTYCKGDLKAAWNQAICECLQVIKNNSGPNDPYDPDIYANICELLER